MGGFVGSNSPALWHIPFPNDALKLSCLLAPASPAVEDFLQLQAWCYIHSSTSSPVTITFSPPVFYLLPFLLDSAGFWG